jgi:hypothetical protein
MEHRKLLYEAFSYYFMRPLRYREKTLWQYGQHSGSRGCMYVYMYITRACVFYIIIRACFGESERSGETERQTHGWMCSVFVTTAVPQLQEERLPLPERVARGETQRRLEVTR